MLGNESIDHVVSGADEQRPLLDGSSDYLENGSIESSSSDPVDVPIAKECSTLELSIIMGAVWFGLFLGALDQTIVANLAVPISADFNSFRLHSWLVSAYMIATAALQPLSGRLTDIFSRRTGLLFSNVFFAAGNLICGLATDQWVIIFGRVIAGIGGGCLNAIATFVASDLIPLRHRGVWQGIGNVLFGVGAGLGGLIGGVMNDSIGWRWAFLAQVPLTVVSAILVYFFAGGIPVRETDKSRLARVDFAGSFTLVLALVLLLLGLNAGGNLVPWTHPLVLASLPASLLVLAAFVTIEDRAASEPIIPVRLLAHRTVAAACANNWFLSMGPFAIIYFVPIYYQVRGLSATQAGVRLIPLSVGAAVGSLAAGLVMRRTGSYYSLTVGLNVLCIVGSACVLGTFDLDTPVWPPLVYLLLIGTGFGGVLTTTLLALIAAVEHAHQAVVTSASYAFRSTGATIGIAIASAVFQNMLPGALSAHLGDRDGAADVIPRLRDSIDEIDRLPKSWQDPARESYMDALWGVWAVALGLSVLSTISGLLMREHILYKNLRRDTE